MKPCKHCEKSKDCSSMKIIKMCHIDKACCLLIITCIALLGVDNVSQAYLVTGNGLMGVLLAPNCFINQMLVHNR